MKTIQTEILTYYTLILQQENGCSVSHCEVFRTSDNKTIKQKVHFNDDFDEVVKWAENCVQSFERGEIAGKAFNLN